MQKMIFFALILTAWAASARAAAPRPPLTSEELNAYASADWEREFAQPFFPTHQSGYILKITPGRDGLTLYNDGKFSTFSVGLMPEPNPRTIAIPLTSRGKLTLMALEASEVADMAWNNVMEMQARKDRAQLVNNVADEVAGKALGSGADGSYSAAQKIRDRVMAKSIAIFGELMRRGWAKEVPGGKDGHMKYEAREGVDFVKVPYP